MSNLVGEKIGQLFTTYKNMSRLQKKEKVEEGISEKIRRTYEMQ